MESVQGIIDNLPQVATITLIVVFVLVVLQEAVNGFHDTANAIATVIYSNSMKPLQAVGLSGVCNFIGVLVGGTAVAFGLVFLLPKEMVAGINTIHEASLMLALILTALAWNFGTWWLGIPNSTTHTYIGSIIGVSMAHAFLIGVPVTEQINWNQGEKVLLTLFVSPVVGFFLAWIFFRIVRRILKDPAMFAPMQKDTVPPPSVRWPLIAGSVGVSLLHGSNDGQKSIGLLMLVLMGIAPGLYAIDPVKDQASYQRTLEVIQEVEEVVQPLTSHPTFGPRAKSLFTEVEHIKNVAQRDFEKSPLSQDEMVTFRAEILDLHEALGRLLNNADMRNAIPESGRAKIKDAYDSLSGLIEHVPFWLIVISALALAGGTAIGYRKIVETLGEKMGEKHMSPAQGIAAQAAAVVSIGMGDVGGMPVSTTHVLTSGVAGTVIASGDRLQRGTLGRIVITWFTTLPGTVIASFAMAIVIQTALV